MNTTEAIKTRRSIRKYQPDVKIPREHFEQMLTAAMMAPSACNTRPWEFVVVEDEELKKQLAKAQPFCKHLLQASAAIVVCARPPVLNVVAKGFWPQDCAAATQNILLQAQELGYGTCWCGLYPNESTVSKVAKLLDVSSKPFSLIVVGKADEQPDARGFYDEKRVRFI